MAVLKPVDITVMAYLSARPTRDWTQTGVASDLGISQSSVHRALAQLERSRMLRDRTPDGQALLELVLHGVRYVYPPELGPPAPGVPTAHAAPILGFDIGTPLVWPAEDGAVEGTSLTPLHRCVPVACERNPWFYELMALIELMRVPGGRNEKREAKKRLREILAVRIRSR